MLDRDEPFMREFVKKFRREITLQFTDCIDHLKVKKNTKFRCEFPKAISNEFGGKISIIVHISILSFYKLFIVSHAQIKIKQKQCICYSYNSLQPSPEKMVPATSFGISLANPPPLADFQNSYTN